MVNTRVGVSTYIDVYLYIYVCWCNPTVLWQDKEAGGKSTYHHQPGWPVGQREFERIDLATLNERETEDSFIRNASI